MLSVAYIKNDCEREQRIEQLARQVVSNHIKRMQKKQNNVSRISSTVSNQTLQRAASAGKETEEH